MSTWKKVLAVNSAGLLGVILSLFIVPSQTPLWMWAIVSVVVLFVLNYLCFGWRRRVNDKGIDKTKSTAVIALGFVVLLMDLILRWFHH
jgi:uncharacterized membrane protein YfcA